MKTIVLALALCLPACAQFNFFTALSTWKGAPAGFNPSTYGTTLGWWAPRLESYSTGASVTSLVDRSGNGLTMSGSGPTFRTSVSGISLSAIEWFGNSTVLASASFTQTQPYSMAAVVKDTQVGGSYQGVMGQFGGYGGLLRDGGSGGWALYAGSVSPSGGTSANWSVVVAVFDGASSFMYVNGAKYTGNPGTGGIIFGFELGGYNSLASRFTGYMGDTVLWSGALSDANAAAACASLQSLYGL